MVVVLVVAVGALSASKTSDKGRVDTGKHRGLNIKLHVFGDGSGRKWNNGGVVSLLRDGVKMMS